ncbi:MAG: hypothetical protein LBN38_07985 [Verrucomicrobiota bacterium]|jgi:hypothetical protein|nr:hypothetical protein [Verrucomicrobiota bacterium]
MDEVLPMNSIRSAGVMVLLFMLSVTALLCAGCAHQSETERLAGTDLVLLAVETPFSLYGSDDPERREFAVFKGNFPLIFVSLVDMDTDKYETMYFENGFCVLRTVVEGERVVRREYTVLNGSAFRFIYNDFTGNGVWDQLIDMEKKLNYSWSGDRWILEDRKKKVEETRLSAHELNADR